MVDSLLKACEKIIKGMKSIEKEEKSLIKSLSYVSIINKNKKEMRNIFQELMKNLKISFIENESTIKYEEYFFNGIPTPKDINLEKNTNYEIRICSVYNDITSNFSVVNKIKTKNLDCLILNEHEKGNEFLQKIYEWTGYNSMELLYRGTKDGQGSNIYHNKCDNQGPTLCLCQNEKGNRFGGYASISWTSDGNNHNANGSFLFTLTNIHNTAPTKYPNTQNYNYAVYHNSGYGPTFGGNHDLYICNNPFNNKDSYCSLGYSYPDVLGKGNSVFSGDANTNYFKLKEIEVFKLINH